MTGYVPTTGQVREAYIVNKGQWRQSAGRGFDAWLDQVKADAGHLAPTQLREEWTTADDGMDGVRSVLDRLADDTTPGEANYVQTFDAYEAAIDTISRIAYPEPMEGN